MSSEEEYTTDDLSSEEDQHHRRPLTAAPAPAPAAASSSRKSTAKPRRWQPHEDKLLTAAVNQCGEANWKSIASKVGSRNHVQCLQRWKKVRGSYRSACGRGDFMREQVIFFGESYFLSPPTCPPPTWSWFAKNKMTCGLPPEKRSFVFYVGPGGTCSQQLRRVLERAQGLSIGRG